MQKLTSTSQSVHTEMIRYSTSWKKISKTILKVHLEGGWIGVNANLETKCKLNAN